jgi:peptidoglycan/LPS O-acetylase OafA/YrhL
MGPRVKEVKESARPLEHGVADKFLSLEGLRGILALTVVFGHFNLGEVLAHVGLVYRFQLAVDVFFMLSGFVLAHSNYAAARHVDGHAFTIKRIARLYPLHLATLLMMVALLAYQGKGIDTGALLRNLLLLHGDNFAKPMFNGPSWSIAVEFWCSILFLLITRHVSTTSTFGRRAWLVVSALVVGLSSAMLHWVAFGDPTGSFLPGWGNYLRGVAGFAIGVIAYAALPHAQRLGQARLQPLVWLSLIGLGLAFVLDWPPVFGILIYGLAFSLILGLAANPTSLPLLSSKPLVWLGTVSYSVYLLHIVIYAFMTEFAGAAVVKGLVGKAILLPLVLLSAWTTYRWLERPAQRMIRRAFL